MWNLSWTVTRTFYFDISWQLFKEGRKIYAAFRLSTRRQFFIPQQEKVKKKKQSERLNLKERNSRDTVTRQRYFLRFSLYLLHPFYLFLSISLSVCTMSFFVLKDDDAANEWIGVIAVHVSDMNGGQKCDRENENDNKNKNKTKTKIKKTSQSVI